MRLVASVIVVLFLSSCASILNGTYQKVEIEESPGDVILVDNKAAVTKDDKFLLKRDFYPKQITIQSEGKKDRNVVVMQYKKSPLHILSWIPFGILLYPPLYDVGPKAYNYQKKIYVPNEVYSILNKTDDMKEIQLNKVGIDLEPEDINYHFYRGYANHTSGYSMHTSKTDDDEIKIENTIFTDALNEILKEKNYIDTTRKVIKNSFLNNLYINASIEKYDLYTVSNSTLTFSGSFGKGGMVYAEILIKWEILDYYKDVIFTDTILCSSGQFAYYKSKEIEDMIDKSVKDAMEIGLIKFMESEIVQKNLKDKSDLDKEKLFKPIVIPIAKNIPNKVSKVVNSVVTIKSETGFGSGFIVSEDGYIISNYHVVNDTTNIEVILNNEKKLTPEVIRVSKVFDLALLKVDTTNLPVIAIEESKDIELATDVYAIGTPTAEDLSQTITKGIISGIRKLETGSKLIQTDASINSGNSGGAMVNKEGKVIGVVSSKVKGFGIEGVAFGIPAYEIIDKLKIKFE